MPRDNSWRLNQSLNMPKLKQKTQPIHTPLQHQNLGTNRPFNLNLIYARHLLH